MLHQQAEEVRGTYTFVDASRPNGPFRGWCRCGGSAPGRLRVGWFRKGRLLRHGLEGGHRAEGRSDGGKRKNQQWIPF